VTGTGEVRILFIGDIMGRPGRDIVRKVLPGLKRKYAIDLTIANGENLAGGIGATPQVVQEIVDAGVEVITFGNHVWKKKEMVRSIDDFDCAVRPANYPEGTPGRGSIVYDEDGLNVGVVCVLGRVFMDTLDCPFRAAKKEIELLQRTTKYIVVDVHAEATSEKRALGWYLDGTVSAVLGTHTHVQTCDETILPHGTGYITDVGMTGGQHSVIGIRQDEAISRFLTQMPIRFEVADEGVSLCGAVVELDRQTGMTRKIFRLTNVTEP
jgi:metallophosphoesterase (TIGR00282 family)